MQKIYFTITPTAWGAGITHQLQDIQAGWKLGKHLGFRYFKAGASILNTERLGSDATMPSRSQRLKNRMHRHLGIYQIYDGLGLGAYLKKQAGGENYPQDKDCHKIHIELSADVFAKNGISSLRGLEDFIRQKIHHSQNHGRAVLVDFRIRRPMPDFFREMEGAGLDLWQIYQNRPRGFIAHFPRRGLKTMVHIRQGDVAAVATPWQTWLYWQKISTASLLDVSVSWRESADESDFDQLTVADFYAFIQNLNAHFQNHPFAFNIFSDGFVRAFHKLRDDYDCGALTLEKNRFEDLMTAEKSHEKMFDVFRKIPNCKTAIGEAPKKFLKWVDAVLSAEMIITAFSTQKTALGLLENFSPPRTPVVIILHKSLVAKALQKYLANRPIFEKAIAVNIAEPDFAHIAACLREYFPNLGEDKKSRAR